MQVSPKFVQLSIKPLRTDIDRAVKGLPKTNRATERKKNLKENGKENALECGAVRSGPMDHEEGGCQKTGGI